MYSREKSLLLKSSASPFTKNLSILYSNQEKTYILVVHKNFLNILIIDNKSQIASECKQININSGKELFTTDCIIQAKWAEFETLSVLIVAVHRGIKIYKTDGSELLGCYTFPSKSDDYPENTYACGIATLNSSLIYVGSYNGFLIKFNATLENNKETITHVNDFNRYHNRPICDLTSNNKQLVSCDDNGYLCVWEYNKETTNLDKQMQFEGYNGFACTCLALHKSYICAGYGSGHLRVFDMIAKRLVCEISAHAKWITSVHIADDTGLLLSTSEDSFVRIWRITDKNQTKRVKHEFSANIANNMLFGGKFLDNSGKSFCVVGYDSNEIYLFKQ